MLVSWFSDTNFCTFCGCQSKAAPARGKKSGNEGEVTCEEEDVSTSEQNQNEKQSENLSKQSDVQAYEQVCVLVVGIT